ncbi:hypothetical protein Bhyg_09253 [Pseudolycoriella hygida]|uniref:Uncharacterized protein n=1 Tax=Pseudolycoriella hygida TaxID=35572 RepID=A0A9Q0N7I6_9DIPT|nr:hypothetical protein Bhyg_09253 [Pseudolycoriella hygida]
MNKHFLLISALILLMSQCTLVLADSCNMASVAPPNNALPSACMSHADGCRFLNGEIEPNGRCPDASYICCVFRCEGEPDCEM